MQITIHDVDHGACFDVTTLNGTRYLLDAGCSSRRGWKPSAAYNGASVDMLILQNLDRDHLEDLPALLRQARIRSFFSNPHVDASALLSMKPEGLRGMHPGILAAHDLLNQVGPGLVGQLPCAHLSEAWLYFNDMSEDGFSDTNNLSVVSYFRFGDFAVLFGGDMETRGWDRLLTRNPHLQERLQYVRVYVASHHGRENGQSELLFKYTRPDLIIFSDGPVEYETQKTWAWYHGKALGKVVPGPTLMSQASLRRVMTTRRDGTITINVASDRSWMVRASKHSEYRPHPLRLGMIAASQ